jgi:hypothetical protein
VYAGLREDCSLSQRLSLSVWVRKNSLTEAFLFCVVAFAVRQQKALWQEVLKLLLLLLLQ